ncbi:MAG: hypothetical protein KBB39_05280 [Phycicoccus sp.]|nr:hypothetical protein [Phycicoccus sp.]
MPIPPSPGAAASPFVAGEAAITRLGSTLAAVAQVHGLPMAQLQNMLRSDPTLRTDRKGGLAYFDPPPAGEVVPAAAPLAEGEAAVGALPTTGQEFQLESLPGADKTIYLDFDGNITEGTSWNSAYGITTIVNPPYNIDADASSWSATELQRIRDSWRVVAEDYAPFNVNVTTKDPGVEALRRSDSGDTQWGVRVVMTQDTFASCGCGGHAYVGSFDDAVDIPAFVYNASFRGVSEAISHEAGHTLNLSHDGLASGTTYYQGHGSGETSWAPIMGASYYSNTTTWSQQEYFGANNTGSAGNYGNGADDLAVLGSLTNGNGFGWRADDVGDTSGTATALTGTSPTFAGMIGNRADVDTFSFTTGSGAVSLTVSPLAIPMGNLDASMTLRDSANAVVAVVDDPITHAATWSGTLAAGAYTVTIDGAGAGNPATSPPIGYTDYASIGQYTLTASLVTPGDVTPPAAPSGLTATNGSTSVALSWAANTEPDLGGYLVQRAASVSGPFTTIATLGLTTAATDSAPLTGLNVYRVLAVDATGNQSSPSATASVTRTVAPTSVFANGSTTIQGTVSGTYAATMAADGVNQSITEVLVGKGTRAYDSLEQRWTFSGTGGVQTLTIVATSVDAGDADAGFRFERSTNGRTWTTVTSLNGSLNKTFALGSPTGTVYLRVIDTNSTSRQNKLDTVKVDLLRIDTAP